MVVLKLLSSETLFWIGNHKHREKINTLYIIFKMATNTPEAVKVALKALEANNTRLLTVIQRQETRDTVERMKELELIQARQKSFKKDNHGKYSSIYNIYPR